MAIVYCSWATGDDTNGTGSWDHPYKTITKASTGLTGGDEVRVAKSPEPTALTGTLGFTNNSTAVTGNGTAFTTELAIGDFVKGGDGYWWEVVTITSNTAATLSKKYSGTTQSGVSSQRLGVTDTGAAASSSTIVQEVNSSGTSSANLKISGGWDLTTETQTGQTFFRQIQGTFNNRYGYGLYFSSKTYTEISHLNFLRYNYGIYYNNSSNNTITSATCNSNGNSGIYYTGSSNNTITGSPVCNSNGQYGIYYYSNSNNNTITGSPTCNSNGSGIYYNGSSNNTITGSPVCNSNGQYGIYYYSSSNNNTITGSPTCNSNVYSGIYYYNSSNNLIYGTLTTTGNVTSAICGSSGINYILKASIAESTKVAGFTNYANSRVFIGNMGGQSYIYTDGGTIVTQAATAGGTGKEWKFAITDANRNSNYPFYIPIARVAVGASGKVTVKLYFRKSGTGIAGGLRARVGQVAWSDGSNDIKVTCPDNTNRNQVTLEFTPTEAGVVEIEAGAWYVSSTSETVIIDDIEITQA